MADILAGEEFATGQQVTADRLNNHVNGAELLAGAITNKLALGVDGTYPADPAFGNYKIQTGDLLLVYDNSADTLTKVTVGDLFENTISAVNQFPTFGSPGIGFVITPSEIRARGPLLIGRDSSEDKVAYTARNWLTIGDTSYQNPAVKGRFNTNDAPIADIVFNNTVDFNENINSRGDMGVNGIFVNYIADNPGYQLFSENTILQIPAFNISAGPDLIAYRNAASRSGVPLAGALQEDAMKGMLAYDVPTQELAFRTAESWKRLATKEFVSGIVSDAVNGPVMKAMAVFTYDGTNTTIHKNWKIDSVTIADGGLRVNFETPMDDVYYAVQVDKTDGSFAGQNINMGVHSITRGLTYVGVYAGLKAWSKSGGPANTGTFSVCVFDLLPETTEEIQPDEEGYVPPTEP